MANARIGDPATGAAIRAGLILNDRSLIARLEREISPWVESWCVGAKGAHPGGVAALLYGLEADRRVQRRATGAKADLAAGELPMSLLVPGHAEMPTAFRTLTASTVRRDGAGRCR